VPEPKRHPFIEKLADEHEELQDFGDEVLGMRFRMAAKRKELRDLRAITSAKAGSVFSLCRRYLHENNIRLPPNVEKEFNEVSSLRDQLGPLEADYDETEAKYNTLEWSYTRKQRRFIEGLLDSDFVPNRSPSADNLDTAALTSFVGEHLTTTVAWNHTAFEDETHDLDIPLLSTGSEDQGIEFPREASLCLHRTSSQQSNLSTTKSKRRDIEKGGAKAESQRLWFQKMKRIDAWLLEMVEHSPVQKAYLKAIHDFDHPSDETWWEDTKQRWTQDEGALPEFHTGDSTISRNFTTRHVYSSTFEAAGSPASIIQGSSAVTMLPKDIASDVPGLGDASGSIGPGDLLGVGDQLSTPPRPDLSTIDEATTFRTTSQSGSRRTSCSGGMNTDSDATSHHSCTCDDCANRDSSLLVSTHGSNVGITTFNYGSDSDGGIVPATPTQRARDERGAVMPDPALALNDTPRDSTRASTVVDSRVSHADVPQTPVIAFSERNASLPHDFDVRSSRTPERQPNAAQGPEPQTSSWSKTGSKPLPDLHPGPSPTIRSTPATRSDNGRCFVV
jgi:hypothetical protein